MAEPRAIAENVRALFAAWNRKAEPDTFAGYELALSDLPDEAVRHAVMRAVHSGGDHPPSAGELRKLCTGHARQDIEALAAAAWAKACRAASRYGLDTDPRKSGDPLMTHAIGAVGGWVAFCTEPVTHWQRRNFLEAYTAAASNPQLEHVAKLSHEGKPIGALPAERLRPAGELKALPGS